MAKNEVGFGRLLEGILRLQRITVVLPVPIEFCILNGFRLVDVVDWIGYSTMGYEDTV